MPVTNSVLDPITISGEEDPTLFGNRVIAHAGATVDVEAAAAAPYGSDFVPWVDTSGSGLELRRTDIAANGKLAALELEQWTGGSQTTGKIAVLSMQGVDQSPTFPAAVDCFVPATGVAGEVSLSADATRVAWTNDQGLRVAGTPTTSADPCALSSPPVVISPTGRHAAIGGERERVPARCAGRITAEPTCGPADDPAQAACRHPAPQGHGEGPGRSKGGGHQGQGCPRRQGQDLRDRPGGRRGSHSQAGGRGHRVRAREARGDGDGTPAADRRRAQEAEAPEGRADDLARDPRRPHHHKAGPGSVTWQSDASLPCCRSPGSVRATALTRRR
jgi:hypothetical protein